MYIKNNQERRRILVVDDEQSIVNSLRRELSTQPLGRYCYEIETFTSPLEALERAKVQEFEVLLSDYRMPEMNGLDFLKDFSVIQPDCVCIVLSGQTDFPTLIRMINEQHIYRFIPKPWSNYFLKSSVAQAVDYRQASLQNLQLATALRQRGIEMPAESINSEERILVVSNDANNANSIAGALTQQNSGDSESPSVDISPHGISVQTFNSFNALKVPAEITPSCIIVDYAVLGMNRTQFLVDFAEKFPDCTCIIISDIANMGDTITALDLAHIYANVVEPWSKIELRITVTQALTRRRIMLENRALAVMYKANNPESKA